MSCHILCIDIPHAIHNKKFAPIEELTRVFETYPVDFARANIEPMKL